MRLLSAAVFVCLAAGSVLGLAQSQPQAPRNQIAGTVSAVDGAANQVSIKSDKGSTVTITATDRTLVLRIPPGETDPRKGSKIALTDLTAGDRVVAVSRQPVESNSVNASAILVMTKSDVAAVRQKEQEDWRRRGVTGTATAVDPAAKTITLKVGQRTVTIQTSDKTEYRRYSPDSARFADAKPSSLAEVKTGDQVRVLGNHSEDGGTIAAEQVVFGTFRQIAATISAIDPATGEVKVTDLATKKPIVLEVNSDSTMRKLPEMAARMLARRYAPGAQQGGGPGEGRGGGRAGMEAGRALGGRGGRGGGDIAQMLDRLPAMPISELKPGDAVMVCTTSGSDPSRLTVVTLLAGVEPLLTASPAATRDIMGGWNLGAGAGEGGGDNQ